MLGLRRNDKCLDFGGIYVERKDHGTLPIRACYSSFAPPLSKAAEGDRFERLGWCTCSAGSKMCDGSRGPEIDLSMLQLAKTKPVGTTGWVDVAPGSPKRKAQNQPLPPLYDQPPSGGGAGNAGKGKGGGGGKGGGRGKGAGKGYKGNRPDPDFRTGGKS